MTPEQFAQFSIFNELNFYGGLFLGLLIAGFFKSLMSFFYREVQRPRKIRYRMLQGKADKKTDFEYLYLFKGEYYTLEQRDFLIKQRLKDIKKFSKFNYSILFFILFISILCFTAGYFFQPLGI